MSNVYYWCLIKTKFFGYETTFESYPPQNAKYWIKETIIPTANPRKNIFKLESSDGMFKLTRTISTVDQKDEFENLIRNSLETYERSISEEERANKRKKKLSPVNIKLLQKSVFRKKCKTKPKVHKK
jgi:hypothetical protein